MRDGISAAYLNVIGFALDTTNDYSVSTSDRRVWRILGWVVDDRGSVNPVIIVNGQPELVSNLYGEEDWKLFDGDS